MSQESSQVRERIKEILAKGTTAVAAKPVAVSNPSGVEAPKPSNEQRVQETPAQRAMALAGKPGAVSNSSGVEEAKPSNAQRIQEILAQRAMLNAGKTPTVSKPGEMEARSGTETRISTSVDLKSIENNMRVSITALGQVNNSLASFEKELHMLTTLFKVVLGVGVVGVVLVIGVILRLTSYI